MTKNFAKTEYFKNRELSWIDFNGRVLQEARDKMNPLLERVNFLGITQSNVDEFFMVRVASLTKMEAAKVESTDASGMTPQAQIISINEAEHQAVRQRYSTYNKQLIPALADANIHLLSADQLTDGQAEFIERYFNDEIYPILTPMADDSSRPFPFISNNSLNLGVLLKDEAGNNDYATLRVPTGVVNRLVKLPEAENDFILLEDIIKPFLGRLFTGYTIKKVMAYRLIRDMDLDVAERDASDLLMAVQDQLKERERGHVVRLEIDGKMTDKLCRRLVKKIHVDERAIYEVNGPIDLTFLKKLPSRISGHDDLKYQPFHSYQEPALDKDHDIFAAMRQQDHLMQHPYDTFDSVVNFIHQAATDEQVLAIKMTLYRVSKQSPIIRDLGLAAQRGKQVTVLVEVKARFDEDNNVHWAQQLEKMGCHVIYGLVGLKTHSKIALVIRRDEDGIRRYLHLGTGNYNDSTARFYTDMGLLTCNRDMGMDATTLFNMLSGYSQHQYLHKMHQSPKLIRQFINQKIDEEIAAAQAGNKALIKMKMNSLSDKHIIEKLYEASAAGVKIHLLIRGICCLRTDLPGVSDNIKVHSIVGRFLEHSRIYYFYNDGNEDVYLSSADMMTRNLNRRVELLFPVLQTDLHDRVLRIFDILWRDNVKTRVLHDDQFERVNRRNQDPLDAQQYFVDEAEQKIQALKASEQDKSSSEFQPLTKHPDNLSLDSEE
ncbi:RNA degradosome polyphosphate kinase [Limosilactobacillus gastricus]|uniref:Polyphosphate kinase n=1 Tax=Limosilactobacillus gastricus DSM 16045 TaxID=1423749 RepID=A0A0R1VCV7_9LACO|nr:RNA degradosome polyphosphate kinase [Limosilactobacillus gastricus]KRM03199.1 Polyphosphate kinase [Limosilactobacillus gastricus DSM 16045]QGF40077.1 RNA degradosome polyphosphate kinase [Limosilactobacillus gastricus]